MTLDVVVMVGLQGCGKSTWVREHLADTHVVVSKDHWPNARHKDRRQHRMIEETLAAGRDVVVDNTNPSPEERAAIIEVARQAGARTHAVFVDTPLEVCLQRNGARAGRAKIPVVGVLAARKRLIPPDPAEGFDDVTVVRPL